MTSTLGRRSGAVDLALIPLLSLQAIGDLA